MDPAPSPTTATPALAANIMRFGRLLRAAGLPVGPGRVLTAVTAVETVGVGSREDVYWALHAVFVNRRDQRRIFDQAFQIFWRMPDLMQQLGAMPLPFAPEEQPGAPAEQLARRLLDALHPPGAGDGEDGDDLDSEIDAAMTWSHTAVQRQKDFQDMSAAEIATAKRAIAQMRLPLGDVVTRRFRPDPQGERLDMRNTLRAAIRGGGNIIPLRRRRRRRRPPPIVVLCDISGSMDRYSRMLLHFLHALTGDRARVHSFVFGTTLTNITRHLKHRDVDRALDHVAKAVDDWSGGTRIGKCLHTFNQFWSRRVLGQGAVVLLITDGLDRDAGEGLEIEIARLHRSCRSLLWLNPLLRYEGYAPIAQGAKALMPHVDGMATIHNLEGMAQLATALSDPRLLLQNGPKFRQEDAA